jgi:hypothetical protein
LKSFQLLTRNRTVGAQRFIVKRFCLCLEQLAKLVRRGLFFPFAHSSPLW